MSRFSRLFRQISISCRFIILIAIFWLLVFKFYQLSLRYHDVRHELIKHQESAQLQATEASFCAENRGNYSHLKADIKNQPELVEFLETMQTVPLILIDQQIIEQLLNEDSTEHHSVKASDYFHLALHETNWYCLEGAVPKMKEWQVEIEKSAIAFENKQTSSVKILVSKLINKGVDNQIIIPFSGTFLQTDKRIIAFVRINEKFLIELNGAYVFVPTNLRLFLQRVRRGYFIDCKQSTNRIEPEEINSKAIGDLAKVRNFVEEMGAMFYLEAGTLLGWYRDCSIIQHTTDLDVSVPFEYFTESFNKSIFSIDLFKVWKQFGRVNDSLEFATFLGPFGRGEKLDIFFNYQNHAANFSSIGGWGPPNYLMWYELPLRAGYCSGDLFGHLFAVPCNVEEWLLATYGKDFMIKQAFDWERKNGTYPGPVNYHIYGTFENRLVAKGFFKHSLYGT